MLITDLRPGWTLLQVDQVPADHHEKIPTKSRRYHYQTRLWKGHHSRSQKETGPSHWNLRRQVPTTVIRKESQRAMESKATRINPRRVPINQRTAHEWTTDVCTKKGQITHWVLRSKRPRSVRRGGWRSGRRSKWQKWARGCNWIRKVKPMIHQLSIYLIDIKLI